MNESSINTLRAQSTNGMLEDIKSTAENGSTLANSAMEQARRAMEEARKQARRAREQQRQAQAMARKAQAEAKAQASRANAQHAAQKAQHRANQSVNRALAAASAAQKRAAEAKAGHQKALRHAQTVNNNGAARAQAAKAEQAAAAAVRAAQEAQQIAQEVAARQNGTKLEKPVHEQVAQQKLPFSADPNTQPSNKFVPHAVRQNTTLEHLAARQGASLEALRRLNPQLHRTAGGQLLAGQSVLMPTSLGSASGAFSTDPTCENVDDPTCEKGFSFSPDPTCEQPQGSFGSISTHNPAIGSGSWENNNNQTNSIFDRPHKRVADPTVPGFQPGVTGPAAVGTSAGHVEISTAHRTDFLTMHGPNGEEIRTHTYAGQPPEVRAMMRAQLKANGYTDMYVYVANDEDYGGPSFNFYDKPEAYAAMLKELADDGIRPVPWMIPDDNHHLLDEYPPGRMMESWSKLIPAIDPYVSSYCLGLELNEYLPHGTESTLGNHLNSLTDKPIFVHYTPGGSRSLAEPWVDGIIYQYGFGKSASQIEAETRRMVARANSLGKVFIAGEYSLDSHSSKGLGAAAMRGGAHGFGNGGAGVSSHHQTAQEPNEAHSPSTGKET